MFSSRAAVFFFFLLIFSSHTEKDSHAVLENEYWNRYCITHISRTFSHRHTHTRAHPRTTHNHPLDVSLLLLLFIRSHETDFGFDAERCFPARNVRIIRCVYLYNVHCLPDCQERVGTYTINSVPTALQNSFFMFSYLNPRRPRRYTSTVNYGCVRCPFVFTIRVHV